MLARFAHLFFFFFFGLVVWITSKTWVTVEEINFLALLFWYCLQLSGSIFFGIQLGKFKEEGQTPEGGLGCRKQVFSETNGIGHKSHNPRMKR